MRTLASPVPDLAAVPLDQVAAMPAVTLEDMVQRVLPGSACAPSPSMVFSSSI